MLLSQFKHRQQRREADCLVACADMVLNHLGLAIDDARLAKILRVGAEFTPFSHLRYLEQLGLSIILETEGEVSLFETYIAVGLPIIVGVKTLNWPHWGEIITEHAVVVVGIDQAHDLIYLHDPFFADAPIEMDLLRFETGWEEKERWYAVIGLAPL
jgi:ABC-type bacteriocin/lantibiotic exporter with double-glycine peptidase domain